MSYLYQCIVFPNTYVRMSSVYVYTARVRCVVMRLRTCLLICIWENIDDERRIRGWMKRSTGTACFLDIQSRAITVLILESFPIEANFYFHFKRDGDFFFMHFMLRISALRLRSLCSVRPWNRFFYEKVQHILGDRFVKLKIYMIV